MAGVASGLISTVKAPCCLACVDEPGRRIDDRGGADGDEDVALARPSRPADDHVRIERFAEPDHARTNQSAAMRAARRQLVKRHRVVAPSSSATSRSPASSSLPRSIRAGESHPMASLSRRALAKADSCRPSTFCVINLKLREAPAPVGEHAMRGVRLARGDAQSGATRTIPTRASDRGRSFGGGERFGAEVLPQAVGAAKRRHAARGRNARTGQHRDAGVRSRGVRQGQICELGFRIKPIAIESLLRAGRAHLSLCAPGTRTPAADSGTTTSVWLPPAHFDVGHVRVQLLQRRHHVARTRHVDGVVGIAVDDELRNRLHVLGERRRADAGERHQRRPGLRILRRRAPTCRSRPSNGRSGRCATRRRCRRPSSAAALRARPSRCTRRGAAMRRRPRP